MQKIILPSYEDIANKRDDGKKWSDLETFIAYNEPPAGMFRDQLQRLVNEIYELGYNDGIR